jgi:hypothetical protein
MNGLTVSNINRAIINGEKKGVFLLPKGASGKVKLAKGAAHDKEVCCLLNLGSHCILIFIS